MIRYFSFGQYTCRIIGNKQLINLIPDSWSKFAQVQASPKIIQLFLEEKELESGKEETDGWFISEKQGLTGATYFQSKKLLFSLYFSDPHEVTIVVRNALDNYIRTGVHYGLMLGLYQECIGMHGVTILCGNEIVLLSAPSGTGKTTLAKLLEKYCDAIIINGDFALLSLTDESVIFEPTPFCGTSGRSLNHRFRVSRVVFLSQAKTNVWSELNGREAMTQFMSNVFVPTWDYQMQQTVQNNILRCISMLKVNAYAFEPTQEAAEVFLKEVEGDSSQRSE